MGNFFFLSSGYFKWNYHAKEKNEDCDCEESDGNDEGETKEMICSTHSSWR
jgi:hypothetical protein